MTDDEPGMRMGVARALRNFSCHIQDIDQDVNFDVQEAETGEEALELIEAQCPDILLLDHKLPGISGLDVLDAITNRGCDMLTVMITAYATLETAVSATKRGAHDFLAKPFTPGELHATVSKTAKHLLIAREARRLAEERRQVRFQFISVLAHELKSPLAAVEGYLNIIRDKAAGEELAAYDKMLDRSVIRIVGMRKLIMDLLDLTRIESGRKQREITTVDLREVAEMAIETVKPSADDKGVTIEMKCDGDPTLTGDRGEMEIICNNLISNAVKYNRDGGSVNITMSVDADEIKMAVADTGIGLTQEEAAKLFSDFVRIKNNKTKNIDGSGLGLSIVKKLAGLYAGDVNIVSQPDVGSTFTVTIGRHVEPESNPEA